MDPALMYGMVMDHDEDEDETVDLSGWMSRSPPGLGEAPMLDETPSFTSRPRGGTGDAPSANVAAAAMSAGPQQPQQPQYSYRPRTNSNIGYVAAGPSSPINPLYAHDESRIFGFAGPEKPGLVIATKSVGLALIAGSAVWKLARQPFPSKTFTAGILMYAHPVLGWNHGYLLPNSRGIGGSIVKGAGHALALGAVVKGIEWVTTPRNP